jgi:hypothetical protein
MRRRRGKEERIDTPLYISAYLHLCTYDIHTVRSHYHSYHYHAIITTVLNVKAKMTFIRVLGMNIFFSKNDGSSLLLHYLNKVVDRPI